jgi:primosomal protein N'
MKRNFEYYYNEEKEVRMKCKCCHCENLRAYYNNCPECGIIFSGGTKEYNDKWLKNKPL